KTGNQISDETDCDYNGPWCHHGNCDCINKLFFIKPVIFIHNAAMQKRNDGKTASKNKCTRLSKKPCDLPQCAPLKLPKRNSRKQNRIGRCIFLQPLWQ